MEQKGRKRSRGGEGAQRFFRPAERADAVNRDGRAEFRRDFELFAESFFLRGSRPNARTQ